MGLPTPQSPSSLMKSLTGAARRIVQSRHPGPPKNPEDSLQRLADKEIDLGDKVRPEAAYEEYDPANPGYASISRSKPAPTSLEIAAVLKEEYQLTCEKCPWKTFKSHNVAALDAMVGQLRVHMDNFHKHEVDDAAVAQRSSERDEFRLATTPITIPEGMDDRINLFHRGRFLPGPLNHRNAEKQAPLVQEPMCANIDMWHIGLFTTNRKTIAQSHDRANRNLNKLDIFSNENLSKRREIKKFELNEGIMTEGDGYARLTKAGDAVLSAYNYYELMRFLHPTSSGTL